MATKDSTPHSTRVAIYARVSTTDQSTDSQLLDLRRYVRERGWDIFKEYVDEGISGSKDSRPALNELMNDAKKRRFDVVLVWRFDRFARSTSASLNLLMICSGVNRFLAISCLLPKLTQTPKTVPSAC